MPEGQLTEEQLANMTPEQIAELQKQNCIFCHIIAGKVASRKVYEDEKVIAILDINPANPGHMVIIPRSHYSIMPQIPEDVLEHIFMVAKGLSHACLKAFKAQGTNIFVANGVVAGQRAQHFMCHIIPRKENDGINSFKIPHKEIHEDDLKKLQQMMKSKINQMMGIKEEVLDLDNQGKEEVKEEEHDKETAGEDIEEELKKEAEEPEKEITQKELDSVEPKKEKQDEIDIDKIADLFK